MKKYNMSEIMKAAWRVKRNFCHLPFGECLRRAWERAKFIAQQITVIATKFTNNMTVIADGYTRTLTRWTKGNFDRVYINGGSRRGDGFVDLKSRKANLRGELTYQVKIAEMILAMEF
ncbi:hypothetical protein RWV98_03065 [Agathobaculum sp. NTUH-O15-33]|uniref:hypothetical protein n=1 Tax=Agathobaculum sp. NTUH-O15-33 TaxID=3079302 RepID=UPI0029589EFC|nr:hypothetical protein [Agathobaculum sp. NTUH-O15-33]WNX85273.1 hypothetical protein RWV98_03065 [Agathobaculum sp. NTUH-O15-33]